MVERDQDRSSVVVVVILVVVVIVIFVVIVVVVAAFPARCWGASQVNRRHNTQ